MSGADLSRRMFLTGSGALVVSIILPARGHAQTQGAIGVNRLNDRIEIRADGTVQVLIGRIEMGQGLKTAIAQLAAEELDIDLERVVIPPVDTVFAPNEGFTDSSASMRGTGMAVRRAAAEARAMLLAMAARSIGEDVSDMAVTDGTIISATHRITYWDLVNDNGDPLPAVGSVTLKRPADYRLLGRDVPRIDLPIKVTGGAAFVQDLRLPKMLHARVLRPPNYGATLLSVDIGPVAAMPGVLQVVRNGSFLAVVATREEQAIRARERLGGMARWRERETMPDQDELYRYLLREADLPEQADQVSERGLSATYAVPYRMHGSIGPSCAVAQYNGGNLTIWSHAQGMHPLRSSLSELIGLPESRVRCIAQARHTPRGWEELHGCSLHITSTCHPPFLSSTASRLGPVAAATMPTPITTSPPMWTLV